MLELSNKTTVTLVEEKRIAEGFDLQKSDEKNQRNIE